MGLFDSVKDFFTGGDDSSTSKDTSSQSKTQTTGGQSRPGGAVIVDSSGEAVGTASIPTRTSGGGSSGGGGGGRRRTGGQSRPSGAVEVAAGGRVVSRGTSEQVLERTRQQQQNLAAQTSRAQREAEGFSGQVTQSQVTDGTEREVATRFFVGGRKVAEKRAGEESFRPAIEKDQTARIEFERGGRRRVVQVTPEQLKESEFKMRQQSAANLLLGGDTSQDVRLDTSGRERTGNVQQVGGILVTGQEIGRTGAESQQVFEVEPRSRTPFTERVTGRLRGGEIKQDTSTGEVISAGAAEVGSTILRETPPQVTRTVSRGFETGIEFISPITGAVASGIKKGLETKIPGTERTILPTQRDARAVTSDPDSKLFLRILALGTFASPRAVVSRGVPGRANIVQRVVDRVRTRKATEIPTESVVAPEFFAGQTFPAIRKGQTAGQLLKEFQPTSRVGVTQLRGFTAAPKPFARRTAAQAGTSEFQGVFQAPKISPRFLRVSGEGRRGFSFSPFGTLRPTATRIKPTRFRLLPGVKASQKNLVPKTQAQETFAKTAQPGESIIPFIKTEKEAVIPTGTELERTGRRFFFRFEGRRIPIDEFVATGEGQVSRGALTTRDVQRISERSRIQEPPLFDISDIGRRVSRGDTSSAIKDVSSDISKATSPSELSIRDVSTGRTTSFRPTPSTPSVPSRPSRASPTPSSNIENFIKSSGVTPSPISTGRVVRGDTSRDINSFISSNVGRGGDSRRIFGEGRGRRTTGGRFRFKLPKPTRQAQQVTPQFKVLVRRRGEFRIAGFGRTPQEAVGIGANIVGKTLAATFKVPSFKGTSVKGFRTKKEDEGFVFIEPRKRRLGTAGELSEIQAFLRKSGKVGGKKKSSPASSVQKEIKKQMMFFRKKDDDSIGILAV